MGSKKVKYTEANGGWFLGAGGGAMGRCWSKGTKSELCRMSRSRVFMHMVTIANNTVLHTRN